MRRKQTFPYYILLIPLFLCGNCRNKRTARDEDIILRGGSAISNKEAREIFEIGLHSVEQGDYGTARQRFLEADHACPNNPEILNSIGGTYTQTGNPERGISYFARALKIDSNYINSYANFGASLNHIMRFEDAKQIFRRGLGRPSDNRYERSVLFLNLANSYFSEKEYDSALVFIDSAKKYSGRGRVYELALKAQSQINVKMPQPATRR
jgi:Tfp pilus assembly protein PilF